MKIKSYLKTGLIITALLFFSCEENDAPIEDETPNDELVTCENISFKSSLVSNAENDNTTEYTFEATGIINNDEVFYTWTVNDELINSGLVSDGTKQTINYTFTEPGTYEICVSIETNECSRGSSFCAKIKIGDTEDPEEEEEEEKNSCPQLSFTEEVTSRNGLSYQFEVNDDDDFAYEWFINGELVSLNSGLGDFNTFDYTFPEAGLYNVCLTVETPDCPEGTEYCREIRVTAIPEVETTSNFNIEQTNTQTSTVNGCKTPVFDFTISSDNSNKYLFKIISENESSNDYVWNIRNENGIIQINSQGNDMIAFEFGQEGIYTVTTSLSTEGCEDAFFSKEFTVTRK